MNLKDDFKEVGVKKKVNNDKEADIVFNEIKRLAEKRGFEVGSLGLDKIVNHIQFRVHMWREDLNNDKEADILFSEIKRLAEKHGFKVDSLGLDTIGLHKVLHYMFGDQFLIG